MIEKLCGWLLFLLVVVGLSAALAWRIDCLYTNSAQAYELPLDIPSPPKQPTRPEPRWYSFADVRVAPANGRYTKDGQRENWNEEEPSQ